jgi:hypothetical protein
MKRSILMACSAALALAACSEAGDEAAESYDIAQSDSATAVSEEAADSVAEADEPIGGELAPLQARPDIPVTLPKIAYTYDYGFRLPGDDIAALQKKHADMCEAQGPYACRILSKSHSGEEGEYASGTLELAVVSDQARAFGEKLTSAAEQAGGEAVAATIEGEDLSKALVDTEAHLATRVALRDRLLEVLKTRRGTVAELVEAERSVARVNEEIDAARSWLEQMKTRVAFSRVEIDYGSSAPAAGAFVEPIRGAIGSLGSILGTMIAALIVLAAVGGPLALGAFGAVRLRRKLAVQPAEA